MRIPLALLSLVLSTVGSTWTQTSWTPLTYCPPTVPGSTPANYYASAISPLSSGAINVSGNLMNVFDVSVAVTNYPYEATRWTQPYCDYCPYDQDAAPASAWSTTQNTAVDAFHTLLSPYYALTPPRMYGPCFGGNPSQPMPCVQHPAFFPPQILGEYYYPIQDNAFSLANMVVARHEFLLDNAVTSAKINNSTGQAKPPTWYGLGMAAVKDSLASFSIKRGDDTNWALTNLTRQPFALNNWTMWAQLFCSPGCHRDQYLTLRGFTSPADYQNNTQYQYLSRFFSESKTAVVSCEPCRPYTAVAAPFDAANHDISDPRAAPMNTYCIPWFGGLPSILLDPASGEPVLQYSTINSSPKVGHPSTRREYTVTPCPLNTFNRNCALGKLQDYNNYRVGIPGASYGCTPCEAGWTTNGSIGAWFCLPPLGQIFSQQAVVLALKEVPVTNYAQPSTTTLVNGSQWRNRNLWAYELECGRLYTDCKQCGTLPTDPCPYCLPDEFNEQMIFSKFFQASNCSGNFYCPDAFTQIACNASFPYSPPGSWSPQNCTCAQNTYLSGGRCVACTQSCTPGFYVRASQCINKNGATQDAPCLPCSNIDNSSMTPVYGSQAVMSPQPFAAAVETASGAGLCSYHCSMGYTLARSPPYTCTKTTFKNASNQAAIWSPAVQYTYDWLIYSANVLVAPTPYLALTTLPSNAPSQWFTDTTQCPPMHGVPQYLGPYMGSNYTQCITCPQPGPPSAGGRFANLLGTSTDAAVCTDVACPNGTLYINYTTWACEPCAVRQQKVCDTGLYLYGQGCLGFANLFNSTTPANDCHACDKNPSNANPGYYLNMDTASSHFCNFVLCTAPPGPLFWPSDQCVGGHNSVWQPCPAIASCLPTQYLSGTSRCGNTAYWPCVDCTLTVSPGQYILANCTATTDSTTPWCPQNSYCLGGTAQPLPCPDIMQTMGTGAQARHACFCPLGYSVSPTNPNACVPFEGCPNTTTLSAPGVAKTSPYYMELVAGISQSYVTQCSPCTKGEPTSPVAYARGTTFGFNSCGCGSPYYGVQTVASSMACTACLSGQMLACTAPQVLPVASCAVPGLYVASDSANTPACQYTSPPFGTLNGPQSAAFTCTNVAATATIHSMSFQPTTSTPNLYIQGATGSSLYASAPAAWQPVYAQLPHAACWSTSTGSNTLTDVSNLAVSATPQRFTTGPTDIFAPYAFWTPTRLHDTVNEPLEVYAACFSTDSNSCPTVQCVNGNLGDDVKKPLWSWAVSGTNFLSTLEALSVSDWFVSGSAASIYIAVVVRKPNTIHLQVTTAVLQSVQNQHLMTLQTPTQTDMLSAPLSFSANMSAVQVVDLIYAPSYSLDANVPVFIMAYNDAHSNCGVAIFGLTATTNGSLQSYSVLDLCHADVDIYVDPAVAQQSHARSAIRSITAITLDSYPNQVTLLIVYADAPYIVYQTTLQQNNPNRQPLLTELLQYANTAAPSQTLGVIRAMYASTDTPVILGLVSGAACSTLGGSASTNCLFASDTTQRTFVGIQDAPFGATPSLVSAANLDSWILASYGSQIYALAVAHCTLAGQYWNGQQCVHQACQRIPQCSSTQTYVNSQCICKDGFYINRGVCQSCPSGPSGSTLTGSYCALERQQSCPLGTQTVATGAYSSRQCLCPQTGQFYDTSATTCQLCAQSHFCPDQWDSFVCPSPFVASATATAGAMTPVNCVCAPGYYGAACLPCPGGQVCPKGINAALNQARVFTIAASSLFYSKTQLAASVRMALTAYYSIPTNTKPGYAIIIANAYVAVLTKTRNSDLAQMDFLVIMLQGLPTTDQSWPVHVRDYKYSIQNFTSLMFDSSAFFDSAPVPVNKPIACTSLQQPDLSNTICMCSAGNGVAANGVCSVCPVNTYSAVVGTQAQPTCVTCPLATWTNNLLGQTNCTSMPAQSDASNAQSPNTVAIIAGTVGGLVFIIIIIIIVFIMRKNQRRPLNYDYKPPTPITAPFLKKP